VKVKRRIRTGIGSIAVALLFVACAATDPPASAPGGSVDAGATASTTAVPHVAAPGASLPTPRPSLIAQPGTVILGDVESSSDGQPRLHLRFVALADGTTTTNSYSFDVPDGWKARTNDDDVMVSHDGWAAIGVERRPRTIVAGNEVLVLAPVHDSIGVVVVDLLGDRGSSDVILGSSPVWLPDGTLLLAADEQPAPGTPYRDVARRIRDHGLGEVLTTRVDDDVAWPVSGGRGYSVLGDGSGITAIEPGARPWTDITLRWDGTVVGRDVAEPPILVLGTERLGGRTGERIVDPCDWGGCPRWRRPDGTRLKLPRDPWEKAWTRDGTALVTMKGPEVTLFRDSPDGLLASALAPIPPEGMGGDVFWIAGMTDDHVMIQGDDERVTIVPLDGSPVVGVYAGWLSAVIP
jgi:hypothetical protein